MPDNPSVLRELAKWYRKFADRAGSPWVWEARLITADRLKPKPITSSAGSCRASKGSHPPSCRFTHAIEGPRPVPWGSERRIPSPGQGHGPIYRVHFKNRFARGGQIYAACQRSVEIHSAKTLERAIEAAKRRRSAPFVLKQASGSWRCWNAVELGRDPSRPALRRGATRGAHGAALLREGPTAICCLARMEGARCSCSPAARQIDSGAHGASAKSVLRMGSAEIKRLS